MIVDGDNDEDYGQHLSFLDQKFASNGGLADPTSSSINHHCLRIGWTWLIARVLAADTIRHMASISQLSQWLQVALRMRRFVKSATG
jgi:hypothetical protein